MSNIKPTHYQLPNGLQVFDLIEDWSLGFHGGNVLKYALRAGVKNPETYNEDLDKAIEYVKRMQERGITAKTSAKKRTIPLILLDEKHLRVIFPLLSSNYNKLISEIEKLKTT